MNRRINEQRDHRNVTLQIDGPLRVSIAIIWANLLSPRMLG
jgi:hypothetical protein